MNMQLKSADIAETEQVSVGDMEPAQSRSYRRLLQVFILLAALAGAVYLTYPWLHSRWTHVVLDDARIAANMVSVSSELSGQVTALPVIAGDHVAQGQILAEIDAAAIRQDLKALEAQIRGVKAQENQLRAQQDYIRGQLASKLQAANAEIEVADASHAAATAALDNARSQFERVNALAGRNVLSTQQQEDAKAKLEAAIQEERATAARIKATAANLEVIKSEEAQIGVLDQQIAVLEAQIVQLNAQMERQRLELAKHQIRAAFDGVVDSTFVDVGEYVSPGTRLLIYHDPQTVWVDANVKETDFRKLALGAPVSISVDAYPDREFKGEVVRLGEAAMSQFALLPSPNPSGNFTKVTQRLPVRISVEQEDGLLRPGMMVEASIDVR